MRILGRYVFREILASSLLATILATFIIFLRGISPLVELLVRSGNGMVFLQLCVLALPPVLLLSIPFGVLVGILIGLGRMSSDNEMVAMRSGGVPTRVGAMPVLAFATLAMLVAGLCSVWWSPLAIRSQYKLRNKVAASLMTPAVASTVCMPRAPGTASDAGAIPSAMRHAPCAMRHAPCIMRHAPCAMRHAPCAMHHAPCTMHHAPCIMHHASCAMRHAPCAMHHTPCNMPHAPCIMHHASCAMRHAPCAMHHAPCNMPHATCHMQNAAPHAPAPVYARSRSLFL